LLLIATLVVMCVSIRESARHSYFSPRVRGRPFARGILPSFLSPRHRSAPSVPSITLLPDTYTDFGDVTPINAPPKDKTVKMVACADPSNVDYEEQQVRLWHGCVVTPSPGRFFARPL
jgi:hypothetical protein